MIYDGSVVRTMSCYDESNCYISHRFQLYNSTASARNDLIGGARDVMPCQIEMVGNDTVSTVSPG